MQNKLNEVSNDINKIEIDLASVTTPINELNRFLGGNVTTGRLGEWSLESIVQDIMPNNSYKFQDQINNESADRVDCSITTAEGFIVPIDSKFYAGQYQNFQSAGSDVECLTEKRILILGPNTLAAFLDTIRVGHHYLKLNDTAAKVAKVVRGIQKEFNNLDISTETVIKRLDGALKDVQNLQTRVNVLGNKLEKGSESLEEE